MQLQYIKQESCPICGNTTIVKEWIETECLNRLEIAKHCDGGTWEHRQFACGQELKYIPNGNNTEVCKTFNVCTNTNEYREKIKAEKKSKTDVLNFINNLDVNDIYKERLYKAIKYIY